MYLGSWNIGQAMDGWWLQKLPQEVHIYQTSAAPSQIIKMWFGKYLLNCYLHMAKESCSKSSRERTNVDCLSTCLWIGCHGEHLNFQIELNFLWRRGVFLLTIEILNGLFSIWYLGGLECWNVLFFFWWIYFIQWEPCFL